MKDRKKTAREIARTEDLAKIHNGGIKTACTSAVLAAFGISLSDFRYSQFLSDVVNILRRNGYQVRSRKSSIRAGSSVGSVRPQLAKLGAGAYLIMVDGHVLLLGSDGTTLVDTDPRKRDRRKIKAIYKINKK